MGNERQELRLNSCCAALCVAILKCFPQDFLRLVVAGDVTY